jgi:hypothetical protein
VFDGDNDGMPIQITNQLIDDVYNDWKEKGFPHYPTDYTWRKKEFAKLQRFDRSTLLKPKNKAIGSSPHGLALAWSYMPHHWGIKCGTMKTPVEIWNDEKHFKIGIRKLLEGTFWEQKEHHNITASDMRSLLRRYSGTQAVSNFRPTTAALMYDRFLEKSSPLFGTKAGTTWDMSCGYGGRLLGSIAADVNYIGTDPCTETFNGLEVIRDEWGSKNRTIELHQIGSEEFWPDANSIDLCFTSPPYFDWEKYSEEETQSFKKYPEVQDWIDGFLWHTIDKCHYGLKAGGILALNVANTRRIKNFEEETVRIAKQIHYKHIDTWKLQLSSQTGSPKYEPIFIFQK